MIYYVSASSAFGDGTRERPFHTIQEAANVARPGDEVIVAPGVYHEDVDPKYGGTEDARITYRSEVPLAAVITGAEPLNGWEQYQGDTWVTRVQNGVFGAYNPYTVHVKGDWYSFNPEEPVHIGEVYLDGKSIYETGSIEKVLDPKPSETSWDRERSLLKWHSEQEDGCTVFYVNLGGKDPNKENVTFSVRRHCFYPSEEGRGYITLSGFTVCCAATQWAPPTAYQKGMIGPHWSKGWIIEDCEVYESKCSGISLGKYLQPYNNNKWTTRYTKDGTQTERDAICRAQLDGWTKERIGSHIVRRCHIHDCGQTGIVGHLGGVFSIIEDNDIHNINNKQELTGAEIGGIKMHAAIDVIIRRNRFHHCTRGLWLDWQAQGTRVTGNIFHHNEPAEGCIAQGLSFGEDIFVEVSHGPTLIDHNIFLSACTGRMSTQGFAFCHNLIAGSFTYVGNGTWNTADRRPDSVRYTPYHMPHRTEVAGFMTILHGDARFYNNIFVQQPIKPYLKAQIEGTPADAKDSCTLICGTHPFDGYPLPEEYFARFTADSAAHSWSMPGLYYDHLPVYSGGDIYMNGAVPADCERGYALCDTPVTLDLVQENGRWLLKTDLYAHMPETGCGIISTETLGEAFESEERFENPDGTPIVMDTDFAGAHRSVHPLCGPWENAVTEFDCGKAAQ